MNRNIYHSIHNKSTLHYAPLLKKPLSAILPVASIPFIYYIILAEFMTASVV
jgi:hypothetical protein